MRTLSLTQLTRLKHIDQHKIPKLNEENEKKQHIIAAVVDYFHVAKLKKLTKLHRHSYL